MKAFSAALALFIPLMVMLLGMMMRRMQTGPSQWIGYRTRRSMQSEQAQAALTLGTVPLTERALKRKFGSV